MQRAYDVFFRKAPAKVWSKLNLVDKRVVDYNKSGCM